MSRITINSYGNTQVALTDCMKYMRRFEDGFFDLAIVDPPYFSGPEKRGHYGNAVSPIGVKSVNYLITPEWNVPDKKYFKELLRVSKHYIIWGCNYYDFHFAPGRIVWDKCNGESSFSDCEIAATDLIDSKTGGPLLVASSEIRETRLENPRHTPRQRLLPHRRPWTRV